MHVERASVDAPARLARSFASRPCRQYLLQPGPIGDTAALQPAHGGRAEIKQIHGLGDVQKRVGVELEAEPLALVVKISLNQKVWAQSRRTLGIGALAAEP